ncbi:MAG TPA: UDP-glucose 4-epimerase GalE, partial [Chitinophagaceae bacterium]|nr:UDP-glucose 4-epimerase GalE [Chitinophagaceae bacterium]
MGRTIEASSIRNFASEGNKSPIESELSPLSGSFALFLPQNNVVSLHPEQSLAQIGGLTASSASDILQQPAGNIAMKENKVDAQTVLVTGGAGYIGSVVVSQLIEVGHKVIVYDNFSRGHPQAVSDPRISVVKGDLADKSLLLQTMRNGDVQTVMHFAAFIEAGESMKKPELYFQNNTANSLNLLVAMLEAHVDTFIFSSTAAVYGTPRKVPIEESAPLEPTNAYGASKLLVENIIAWFHQIHGLRYTSLRYFNACGAAESLGEHHQPESHLIPLAIEAIMGRRPKLYLYGTDYETRDGTCIRDYIHVSDLAEAHLLALNAMAQKKEGR